MILGAVAALALILIGVVTVRMMMSSATRVAEANSLLSAEAASAANGEIGDRESAMRRIAADGIPLSGEAPSLPTISKPRGMPDHVWDRMQSEQAKAIANRADDRSPSKPTRAKMEPDMSALFSSDASGHEQILDETLALADEVQQILKDGVKQPTIEFRDALRSVRDEHDLLNERLTLLPRLDSAGAEKLRSKFAEGAAKRELDQLAEQHASVAKSPHAKDKSFRLAVYGANTGAILERVASATTTLKAPFGFDQKAELLVIEISRDLLAELATVQNGDQYQALTEAYRQAADNLGRVEEDWGFFFQSKQLLDQESPFRGYYGATKLAIDQKTESLRRQHGSLHDDSELARYESLEKRLLASKQEKKQAERQAKKQEAAAERKRHESFQEEVESKGIGEFSRGRLQSIEFLRKKYPDDGFVVIHHDAEVPLKQRHLIIKSLDAAGCKDMRFYDSVIVLFYSGPIDAITKAINWGDVNDTDPQNLTIQVALN